MTKQEVRNNIKYNENLVNQYLNTISRLRKKVNDLNSKINQYNSQISQLNSNIKSKESQIDELNRLKRNIRNYKMILQTDSQNELIRLMLIFQRTLI